MERVKTSSSSSKTLANRLLHKNCSWLMSLYMLRGQGGKIQGISYQGAESSEQSVAIALNMQIGSDGSVCECVNHTRRQEIRSHFLANHSSLLVKLLHVS